MTINTQENQTFPFVIRGESTPHISDVVFKLLDRKTLAKSRLVSSDWRDFVDSETSLWVKVSTEKYIRAAEEGMVDICRLIAEKVKDKNPKRKSI